MKLHVGIIGLGYWGPNYVRNFLRTTDAEIAWICDLSETAIKNINNLYPHLQTTNKYTDILMDPTVDCVAIATPPQTHYKIAKYALLANKHVLIAKPLATNAKDAADLLAIAKKKKCYLMGDLTFLYSGSIIEIRNKIKAGHIGIPLYYDSIRSNLGLIQKDVNVIWDLAPHDLSIIDSWFILKPKKLLAVGSKHYRHSIGHEIAHITITYAKDFVSYIHLSWLSPIKQLKILVGGSKKMVYFNDVEPDEKIRIYDKQVIIKPEKITPFKPVYRTGDVVIPKIANEEGLFLEIQEFVHKIIMKTFDYKNAQLNIKIVELLEACDKSLTSGKTV